MLTLSDGRSELWQWDTGRTLAVDADCSQVHFSNKVFGRSIDVDVVDGVAIIPDILLRTDKELNVWAFVGTAENGYTKISKTFKVNRRNKPSDYVFTPQEQITLKDATAILEEAKDVANDAIESAKQAEYSSTQAAKSADAAADSASAAEAAKQDAAQSASAADSRATDAENAAEEAERSAGIATDAAGGSELNAENAHKSALNAQQSANSAAESQSVAAESAASAERNAEKAATDAKNAADAKVAAAGSADAAAGSANAAASSASAAAGSEQAAGTSELKSAKSEKAAKASEQAAAESAQAALESKTAAAISEVNAAASAKKAQDVADSLPEDYTTAVNEIATLKQHVKNITPDDSSIGDKPWSSKHIIDMLCPPLQESGNPVVCYPVENYQLGVNVSWEPTQEGSGDPSPDNIRPITGRDAVSVTRCGKNLFTTKNAIDVTTTGITNVTIEDNRIVLSQTDGNSWLAYRAKFDIPAGQYTVSLKETCSDEAFTPGASIYYTDKYTGKTDFVGSINGTGARTIEIPNGKYLSIYAHLSKDASYTGERTVEYSNIQIEPGSTATPYEPYTGFTTDIALPETVYGGTLDPVTGDGQETWKLIDNYAGEDLPSKWISDRDVYASGKAPTIGAQVAYILTEPISFTATGAQPIPALSGVNTIYTDADGVVVTGAEDPKHTITELKNAIISLGGNI